MVLSDNLLAEITGCPGLRAGGYRRDLRRHPRFAASAKALVLRLSGCCDDRPALARIREISASSIGLLLREEMRAGQRLAVSIPRFGHPALIILCTVIRCQGVDNGLFVVGATFDRLLGEGLSPASSADSAEQDLR